MLASSELLAGPLAKIFVGYDAGLLALTTHGMKLYSISFILSGFNIFGSAFFTALNNGAVSAAISFLRTLLFQIVSILTLPPPHRCGRHLAGGRGRRGHGAGVYGGVYCVGTPEIWVYVKRGRESVLFCVSKASPRGCARRRVSKRNRRRRLLARRLKLPPAGG